MRLAISLLCTLAVASAQEPPPDLRIVIGVKNVLAPTTVTNRDGSLAAPLKPHQFKLFDNNKEQDIKVRSEEHTS